MHEDPRDVLGIGPDAGEEEVRAAYLRKVKEFPPDRAPREFERVRDAYEILRDPHRRTQHMLTSFSHRVVESYLEVIHGFDYNFDAPWFRRFSHTSERLLNACLRSVGVGLIAPETLKKSDHQYRAKAFRNVQISNQPGNSSAANVGYGR